jgi:hypothetical protein
VHRGRKPYRTDPDRRPTQYPAFLGDRDYGGEKLGRNSVMAALVRGASLLLFQGCYMNLAFVLEPLLSFKLRMAWTVITLGKSCHLSGYDPERLEKSGPC